jgi:membrane protease YdiL (CAAX protease family)
MMDPLTPPPAESPDIRHGPETPDPAAPPPFGRASRVSGVFVLFFLMLVGMIVVGGLTQFLFGFAVNAVITEVGVVLLPILWILQRRNPWHRLGLGRAPQPQALLIAIVGVLGLAMMLAEFSHWSDKVFPMPELFKEAYLQAITAHSLPELVVLVFAAGVVPGFCEEVAFRGYFQPVLQYRYGMRAGVAFAATLFALMHMDPWHLPALFLIGLYLGYLYVWTGLLWVPVTAHFVNNAASVVLVYAAPDASLSQMDQAPPLWLVGLGGVAFLAAVSWLRHHRAQDSDYSRSSATV